MARGKKTDWWDILLWSGVFLLAVVFLYQLTKLWNAGTAAAGGLLAQIPQALTNTLSAIENGFANAATSPLSFFPSLLDLIPTFLAAIIGAVSSWFLNLATGGFSGLISPITTLFGGTSAPVNQGNGSAAAPTITGTPAGPAPIVTDIGDGSSSFGVESN